MTVRLVASADTITGELFINSTKVLKYTDSLFSILDGSGNTKFSVANATGNVTFYGAVSGITTLATTGNVGFGTTPTAGKGINLTTTVTPSGTLAMGVAFAPTLQATANGDTLYGLNLTPTLTLGAYTGLDVINFGIGAATIATSSLAAQLNIGVLTGTGSTNAFALRIAPPTGATNNYIISHTTPATFNVKGDGSLTAGAISGTTGTFSGATTVGANNTSGTPAYLNLYGGSAANGGGVLQLGKNGSASIYIGMRSAIFGAGSTSNVLEIFNTNAGADGNVVITAGNTTVGTFSSTGLSVTGTLGVGGTITSSAGNVAAAGLGLFQTGTAAPAGGANAILIGSGNTALGWGSGAPTYSANKGSLYLRTDGSATNNRMYINTNGGDVWTAVVTVA